MLLINVKNSKKLLIKVKNSKKLLINEKKIVDPIWNNAFYTYDFYTTKIKFVQNTIFIVKFLLNF